MVELRIVEIAQLRPIIEAFASLTWPAPSAALTAIGDRLGWTMQAHRGNGMEFLTGLAVDSPNAHMTSDGKNIGQVGVDVTDRIRQPDAAQTAMFAAAARTVSGQVASILGDPVEVREGTNLRVTWDLHNGGRVAVAHLTRVVQLIVLQQRYADIERRETALGVDDERDPEGDLV